MPYRRSFPYSSIPSVDHHGSGRRTAEVITTWADLSCDAAPAHRSEHQLIDTSRKSATLALMPKAVQFDSYGGVDVLEVRDVPRPVPEVGEVLVEVRAAAINPSEAVIRSGALADQFPATFPSGQGSDLAGVVAELGPGVSDFAVGDEVIGFSMRRSSHAEYVTVPAKQLTANDAWLADHGAVPVNYGDDLPARLRAAAPSGHVDALLDFFGGGYVAMAVDDLKVPRDRVDTIADFAAVEQFGVLSVGGADAATAAVVAELADLVARGELDVPIAGVFALDDVRDAFREVELRHTRGKLVLRP
jgi:NADPH:quinone reductase-like Zn-dependent oxidoreductase